MIKSTFSLPMALQWNGNERFPIALHIDGIIDDLQAEGMSERIPSP